MIKRKIKTAGESLTLLWNRLKLAFLLVFMADEYAVFIKSYGAGNSLTCVRLFDSSWAEVERDLEEVKFDED